MRLKAERSQDAEEEAGRAEEEVVGVGLEEEAGEVGAGLEEVDAELSLLGLLLTQLTKFALFIAAIAAASTAASSRADAVSAHL